MEMENVEEIIRRAIQYDHRASLRTRLRASAAYRIRTACTKLAAGRVSLNSLPTSNCPRMAPCLTNHMALVIVAWLTKTPHQQFYLCASDKKQTLTHPLNLRSPINAIPIISGKTDVIILTTVRGFFFAIVRV